MNDYDSTADIMPSVGDDILVPVHQGGSRTTFFPDQVITVSTNEYVEMIMLRQEFIVRAQKGVVLETRDDKVRVDFTPQGFRPEQFDIGHVRMVPQPAMDMAFTILAQQIEAGNLDAALVMQRLQSMIDVDK